MRSAFLWSSAFAFAAASSGCNSYTVMAGGATGLLVGGVMYHEAREGPDCDDNDGTCVADGLFGSIIGMSMGMAIMAVSGVTLAAGTLGALYDASKEEPPTAPKLRPTLAAQPPAPATSAAAAAPTTDASLDQTLSVHIRTLARAGRCTSANVLANRLAERAPEALRAIIHDDEAVAHCVATAPLGGEPLQAPASARAPAPNAAPPAPAQATPTPVAR